MNAELLQKLGFSSLTAFIVLFLIWLFEKSPIIFEYRRNKKKDEFEFLKKALETNLSNHEKTLLTNISNQKIFSEATGFNGNAEIRESVAEIILNSSNKYKLDDFIKIRNFLIFDEVANKANIEVSKTEWYALTFMRCTFIALMIWLLVSIVIFVIFSAKLFKLFEANPSHPIFGLVILMTVAPMVLAKMYFKDSEKYSILNKIYMNNRELYPIERPETVKTHIIVIIAMVLFYSIVMYIQ